MGNDTFFEGANLACDKLKTFGVKKFQFQKILTETLTGKNLKYFLII